MTPVPNTNFHFILQLDNEEPADDDSDFDEYDSVFLPI